MSYDLDQFVSDCRAILARDAGPNGREEVRVKLEPPARRSGVHPAILLYLFDGMIRPNTWPDTSRVQFRRLTVNSCRPRIIMSALSVRVSCSLTIRRCEPS